MDYEAEYNNRARVPGHLDIMRDWARDAAIYRDKTAGRAELDIVYGEGDRRRYDLFPAAGEGSPLVLFIHGGYWQSLGKSSFSHMAQGLNELGVTVAVAGYTLCPDTTVGGIVDEMVELVRHLSARFSRPMAVAGHSAGGHLAAMLLATPWAKAAPELAFDPIHAALPISGLFELAPLIATSVNQKLGLDLDAAKALSPVLLPAPRGKRLVAVVGGDESSEYLRQTDVLVEAWSRGGTAARAVVVPGQNHFTVIAPLADGGADLTRGLAALAKT